MAITTQFLTGFEHGFVASTAAAGSGLFGAASPAPSAGISASTSSPRNGSYCLHCVAPANTLTRLNFGFTSTAKVLMRFAVKVSSWPSSGTAQLAQLSQVGSEVFSLRISSAGVLQCGAGSTFQNGPTIDTTNYHLIEFQYDGTPKTVDWKVDGVLQTRAASALSGNVGEFSLGTSFSTQAAFTADYDDLICGTWATAATDWYGDGKVIAQLPASDGTHATVTSLSPGDAGTAYSGTVTTANTMVDDAAGTGGWTATRSTTDNLALRTATVGAYLEIKPATTAETGSANAVRAIMSYSSSTTTANLAACDVRNSAGTVTALRGLTGGVGAGYNVTANNFGGGIVTRPAAGWTAAEVNAIRLRFGGCTSADINPVPTVQAMMLEVDWPFVIGIPADETIIDDFNRADGPLSAGAGASIWESAGGTGTNTDVSNVTTAGNVMAPTSAANYARSKLKLASDFDLLFDVSVGTTDNLALNVAVANIGVPGHTEFTLILNTGNWQLRYFDGAAPIVLATTVFGPRPAAGSTVWLARRGNTISGYYRAFSGGQFIQVVTVDDARNTVAGEFVFVFSNSVWRLDNLRGGPLVSIAAKVDTLTENFNAALDTTTKWDVSGAEVTLSSNRLLITPTTGYPSLTSHVSYDLVASSAFCQLVQALNIGSGSTDTIFGVQVDLNNEATFDINNGILRLHSKTAAVSSDDTSITYNATTHAWLRIRESGGNLLWDTSTDGLTWTNRRSIAAPGWVSASRVFVIFVAGYGAEASPGTALFDNLNIAPTVMPMKSIVKRQAITRAATH